MATVWYGWVVGGSKVAEEMNASWVWLREQAAWVIKVKQLELMNNHDEYSCNIKAKQLYICTNSFCFIQHHLSEVWW
jgi:hypothetical protein